MWNTDVKYPNRHISKIPKSTPSSPGPLSQINPNWPLRLNSRIQTAKNQTKTNPRKPQNKALLKMWPCTTSTTHTPRTQGGLQKKGWENVQTRTYKEMQNAFLQAWLRQSGVHNTYAYWPHAHITLARLTMWMRMDSEKVPSCKLTDESTRLY